MLDSAYATEGKESRLADCAGLGRSVDSSFRAVAVTGLFPSCVITY